MMKQNKSTLIAATALALSTLVMSACSSSDKGGTEIVATDHFAGLVQVGADAGRKVNWEAGLAQAKTVCQKWGYADAVWRSRSADGNTFSRQAKCIGGGAEKGK